MFKAVRSFFEKRGVLEVDCPALCPFACLDLHIDPMRVETREGFCFLHTSAEYGMKRLLSHGSGDIYQLSHVFRSEERGPLHSPEFTMIEWYRLGFCFEEMIEETLECAELFLGKIPRKEMRYRELFLHFLGVDCEKSTEQELVDVARKRGVELSKGAVEWDRDTLLQLLLGHLIEPLLGKESLFVLTHFPPSQASLAQLDDGGALRFEVYHKGIELANGYKELVDAREQRERFCAINEERKRRGKPTFALDEDFLAALKRGVPPCCGVAVGFDRLLQLQLGLASIHSALSLDPLLDNRVPSA